MITSHLISFRSRFLPTAAIVAIGTLLLPSATMRAADEAAVETLPASLSKELRRLVVWHRAQPRNLAGSDRRLRLARALPGRAAHWQTNVDATSTVVDVTLDGTVPLATVSTALARLGLEVVARYDSGRAGSILSARLPLDQAEAAVRVPGVYSAVLVHRAWRRVGKTTSQGADVLRASKVNRMNYDGAGITVGVISDSYDQEDNDETTYPYATHAADDVRNGDLPGPGNPFGHTVPVRVVSEAFPGDDKFDEGRAILQIVHDLAPGAQLMFHNAGTTPETLASAITSLRSQTNPACDVIVDDFGFPDEPFFSDGPAALAARDAATSLLLPGHPVVYVSAAGNEGDSAYAADFNPISDNAARGGFAGGNLKLAQVPSSLTAGGFHNFNPKANKETLAQQVKMYGDAEVSFQWDDLFLPGEVSADYNLLVFDADGNYLPDLSGTDNNVATGKAVEIVDLPLGDGNKSITYQFAITRANTGTGLAQHLHYVMNGGGAVVKFRGYNTRTTFGHNAGPNVIGVAAYQYDKLAEPDAYSSLGPVTIYFDAQGNRLATPEVRQQPAVAAVDGVNTSFFPPGPLTQDDGAPGTDTDGDGFPNFFGTSAAAPHVAAVAALLLQAAGGPGSLTAAQILALLQSTARPHDLDPNFASATVTVDDGSTVTLSATADESDAASEDKDGFHLTFDGSAGQYLKKVVVDLGSTGLHFDTTLDGGFPFIIGTKTAVAPEDVTASLNGGDLVLTLLFAPGTFTAGQSLNFGIDRDLTSINNDGNSADLLAGAAVKVRTKGAGGGGKGQSGLANNIGTGYSPAAGFGLVDAKAAVKSLLANPPAKNTAKLVPGDLLLATSDQRLIEITRTGTPVQVIPAPNAGDGGTHGNSVPLEAIVDGNGNIAVLNGNYTPSLITINSQTGAVTSTTVPGWILSGTSSGGTAAGEIVSFGRYIFANYGQDDPYSPLGLLLRFDVATGAVQVFGEHGTDSTKTYVSLSAGKDGLLYAMVENFAGSNPLGAEVDVYDPNTLAMLRTVYLKASPPGSIDLGLLKFAVGPAGEFYGIPGGPQSGEIIKCDANGQFAVSLDVPYEGNAPFENLRVDTAGNILVGSSKPVLIDPAFQTAVRLDVYGSTLPPYTYVGATATFIGP